MEKLTTQNLYEEVKNRICEDIFLGKYSDGDRLPSERELLEELGVSRVTVRKSLELLEQDHLVLREIGRGTQITLHNYGNANLLDMIVLIAPARNPFFSEFIGRFQNYAEKKDTLILYVEKPREESLEKCMHHLYRRGLRSAVIWLEDLPVDPDRLQRLRAIGMNFVFFDTDAGYPYGDCVTTDNEDAIRSLCGILRETTHRITYICWDSLDTYSARRRLAAFTASIHSQDGTESVSSGSCAEGTSILRLPWKRRAESIALLRQRLPELAASGTRCLLCCDRECSELTLPILRELGLPLQLAGVDDISDTRLQIRTACTSASADTSSGILIYRQDLNRTVEQIYRCLENQCSLREKWVPDIYLIPGNVIK